MALENESPFSDDSQPSEQELQQDLLQLHADEVLHEASITVRNNMFRYNMARGLVGSIAVSSTAFVAMGTEQMATGDTRTGLFLTGLGITKAATTAVLVKRHMPRLRNLTR